MNISQYIINSYANSSPIYYLKTFITKYFIMLSNIEYLKIKTQF